MNLENKQAEYNVLVSHILTNKANVSKGLWEIGLDLNKIQERELYLLEFRDFKTFLEKKVAIFERTAYRCMSIAKEFTINDFVKWGLYKLEIIKRELPEDSDKKEFIKQGTAEFGKPVEPQLKEYQINKGLEELQKETSRFEGQVGKPSHNKEEDVFKSNRQFSVIETQYKSILELINTVKIELTNWIKFSKPHKSNLQVSQNIEKAEGYHQKLNQ